MCGEPVVAKRVDAKYCSKTCSWNASYKRNTEVKKLRSQTHYGSKREYYLELGRDYYKRRKEENPEYYLWYWASRRVIKSGIDFSIDIEDVFIPEFCPVLGVKLVFGTQANHFDSPSLDRIDNTKGYIKGNVQVISFRANTLKNSATLEELRKLADWINTNVS